jgi:hypothetical protein
MDRHGLTQPSLWAIDMSKGVTAVKSRAEIQGAEPQPRDRTRRFASGRWLVLCLVIGTLAPRTAFAHVKWFEDPAQHPLRADLVLSDRTLLWLVTSALAVLLLTFVQRRLGDSRWPVLPLFDRMATGAPTILAIQAAIALVAAASQSTLLVPNLALPGGPSAVVLAAVEVLIALSFITGIADWVGALALVALVGLAALVYGPMDALEQALWVVIASVMLEVGRGSAAGRRARPWFCQRGSACADRAVTVLRILTGLALIAVALDEKIWNPELGRAFLVDHPAFNVLHSALGLTWFSDDLFVLAIGLIEAAIGAALISGKLTRLVVLGAWVPFHLGIPLLPAQELIGHLPVFGIMYMLLVYAPRPWAADARQPVGSVLEAASGMTSGQRQPRPCAAAAVTSHLASVRRARQYRAPRRSQPRAPAIAR